MWAEETQEEDKENPSRRSEKIIRDDADAVCNAFDFI